MRKLCHLKNKRPIFSHIQLSGGRTDIILANAVETNNYKLHVSASKPYQLYRRSPFRVLLKMIAIAFLFLLFLAIAQATSRGAGQSACMDITPQPGHGGSSQPLERSPFSLNISQLTAAGGYTPGATYIRMCA